ncbi:hypothetical protein C8R43DRAFT_1163323 [Mycena crocata]|nr:hypothetical protein C8R43DRAFT_1163323 [Mycena crocata]
MAETLPDEIISEILSPALKVPEHSFSDLSPKSPFAKYTKKYSVSSSAALLVCKAWLRVATPLLYHVVIIRSKAQARALHEALQTNPELGEFIKKIRIEGGFATPMQNILNRAPNISDLFLSLQIHSSDSSVGLVAGLPSINPARLIIFDDGDNLLRNKAVVQLMEGLEICVKKWSNMKRLVLPYDTPQREAFILALCGAKTLKIVAFPVSDSRNLTLLPMLVSKDARLNSLLRWAEPPEEPAARKYKLTARPPADPSFQPLASTPQATADRIWSRILFFAMVSLEPRPKNAALRRLHEREGNSKRLKFLRVSKMFHRLGLPYLYRYPILLFGFGERFAQRLSAVPALGAFVHELDFRDFQIAPTSQVMFQHLPHLRRIVGSALLPITWDAFTALARTAGATLEEVSGIRVPTANLLQSPDMLAQFSVLRSLTFDSHFTRKKGALEVAGDVPAAALPALEFVSVKSPGVLPILSLMDLPALRRVALHLRAELHMGTPPVDLVFLRRHGHNLLTLRADKAMLSTESVLNLCPNLNTFSCRVEAKDGYDCIGARALNVKFRHAHLTKLVLSKHAGYNKTTEQAEWEAFFLTFDAAQLHLPALREVRVLTCEWPTAEHAIAKSIWVHWAEKLLPQGIKVMDKEGAEWHPRLKATRR